MIDLSTATATQALAALHSKKMSSEELLDAQLARIERFNPDKEITYPIYIELNP